MKYWYCRPSGHSQTVVIVGTFKTSRKAANATRALQKAVQDGDMSTDWGPDDATITCDKREVRFDVYTAGGCEDVQDFLSARGADKVKAVENPQRLTIQFTFDAPAATLVEVKALLLLQHPVLGKILEDCKELLKHTKQKTIYSLEYFGETIYDEDESRLLGLRVPEEIGCEVSA